MCGRYGLSTPNSQVVERIEYENELGEMAEGFFKRYDIRPSQKVPLIRYKDKKKKLHIVHWGMNPTWSDGILINARREKILNSKFWQQFMESGRCLIPASYFIEWQMTEKGKIPWMIKSLDEDVFFFAGLYGIVDTKKGKEEAVVILTEPANPVMEKIHNFGGNKHRQPVILREIQLEDWLDPNTNPKHILEQPTSYNEKEIKTFALQKIGDDVRGKKPELLKKEEDWLF